MTTTEAKLLLQDGPFLTEGGVYTHLMFDLNVELRNLAAFELLFDASKEAILKDLHRTFADIAIKYGVSIILDTETWRASSNWYKLVGTSAKQQTKIHPLALASSRRLADYVRDKSEGKVNAIVVGTMGPLNDAYKFDKDLSVEVARNYHRAQMLEFKANKAGAVGAYTLSTSTEALAIALEAKDATIPCFLSFTVETDGTLPSGESLQMAVERVDEETQNSVLFFMVNCAHPRHVRKAVENDGAWIQRIRGVRGNASIKSHEELNNSTELHSGDPVQFANDLLSLRDIFPQLVVMGGCCGTSPDHSIEIAKKLTHLK